jgi:hypothetical protein
VPQGATEKSCRESWQGSVIFVRLALKLPASYQNQK